MEENVVTAIGTPNIALIKYWGKRDQKLILPTNSSLSITLDENLNTKTSVLFTKRAKSDSFYINGERQNLKNKDVSERFAVIDILRRLKKTNLRAVVVSNNSFPTASGLASSASGIATLIYASSKALRLKLNPQQMSIIARQGSGSACRSLMGGFVKWEMGRKSDGSDSKAIQVADQNHWPEIVDLVAITSSSKKKVSSRFGMQQTVKTSTLYPLRLKGTAERLKLLEKAIKSKDFDALARITMQDSNNMHSVMLDTYPPIFYMNDISREIVYKIHEINESESKNIAGYTFDAGPNAHILTTKKNKSKVLKELKTIKGISKIIETKIGATPRILEEVSLIDEKRLGPIQG